MVLFAPRNSPCRRIHDLYVPADVGVVIQSYHDVGWDLIQAQSHDDVRISSTFEAALMMRGGWPVKCGTWRLSLDARADPIARQETRHSTTRIYPYASANLVRKFSRARSYGWLPLRRDEFNHFWLAVKLRKCDFGLRVHIPNI
jgi:hypothetical protein